MPFNYSKHKILLAVIFAVLLIVSLSILYWWQSSNALQPQLDQQAVIEIRATNALKAVTDVANEVSGITSGAVFTFEIADIDGHFANFGLVRYVDEVKTDPVVEEHAVNFREIGQGFAGNAEVDSVTNQVVSMHRRIVDLGGELSATEIEQRVRQFLERVYPDFKTIEPSLTVAVNMKGARLNNGSWVEPKTYFPRRHNLILFYKKNNNDFFNRQHEDNSEDQVNFKRWEKYLVDNKIFGRYYPKDDIRFKTYLDKFIKENDREPKDDDIIFEIKGAVIGSSWYIKKVDPKSPENIDYPTQKSEALLRRIIEASSSEGDIVADFFCGSGTTLAVAEKLGRKWIGSDLGRFSIHTTRKRMIGVQRELKKAGKDFRAFEILNIGKYEREKFLTVNENLREEEKRIQRVNKEKEFIKLILSAYKAEPVDSFNTFVGKKRDRLVAVGSIDTPVTNDFLEKIISECKEKKITKADILGFDYEMGLDF